MKLIITKYFLTSTSNDDHNTDRHDIGLVRKSFIY